MPKYLNSNSEVVTIGPVRIEPGATHTSEIWIPTLPAGVTKIADEPYYDSVILSAVYTSDQVVSVPAAALENYKISIYTTGEVTVKFNSDHATAYLIPQGCTLEKICTRRTIDKIILTIETLKAAYIHIEKT